MRATVRAPTMTLPGPHPAPASHSAGFGARPGRWTWILLVALPATLVLHRLRLGLGRDFDPDELQHLHGGFSIAAGLVPYEDYFEHHAPLFPWMLSLWVRFAGADWSALVGARVLMWITSVAAVVATAALAHQASSGRGTAPSGPSTERAASGPLPVGAAAALAAIAQLTIVTDSEKAIEIRPDVPATLAFTLSLLGLVAALRGRPSGLRSAALGGLALGAGLMLTPKLAFAAIGVGVGALVYAAVAPERGRAAIVSLVVFVACSLVPALLMAAILAALGHFGAFFDAVVLGPLHWPRELGPEVHLSALLERNALHVGAAVVGFGLFASRALSRRDGDPTPFLLPGAAAGILVGWFIVPVPWPQFLSPLWPLAAIAIVEAGRWPASARSLPAGAARALTVAALAGAAVFLLARALEVSLVRVAHTLTPALGVLVVAGLLLAVRRGVAWRSIATVAVVVATAAPGLRPILESSKQRPIAHFRAEFDAVMTGTAPDETVLTGWRGCAVFRPHAYRYFFLHPGVRAALDEEALNGDVLRALEARPPGAAIRDSATRALGPDVQHFLDAHFEPTGVGDVWLRKDR